MRRVITYGTFDLLHEGHIRLLERAKALGDFLIVGVTSEGYDARRGKLNVHQSLADRIENVRSSGLADQIIVEEFEGQKVDDIQRYSADVFAIGSDWTGKFDYLSRFCEVIYLDRTPGVSSTELRADRSGLVRIGIVGTGRIATRFVTESKYVSGAVVDYVMSRSQASAERFRSEHSLEYATDTIDQLLSRVDAIYIASPHDTHFEYSKAALSAGVHVLVEKPMSLRASESEELYALAEARGLTILEAIKTAFAPGFLRMCAIAHSGAIGDIVAVDAAFSKLTGSGLRETNGSYASGSLTELGSYPLLAIGKLLGTSPTSVFTRSVMSPHGYDAFTRVVLEFPDATATASVGLGAKTEGDLRVSGTTGYIYVPAPWWKTSTFEVRRENPSEGAQYTEPFEGDGLRYEIAEFLTLIQGRRTSSYKLARDVSMFIQSVIERSPTLLLPRMS